MRLPQPSPSFASPSQTTSTLSNSSASTDNTSPRSPQLSPILSPPPHQLSNSHLSQHSPSATTSTDASLTGARDDTASLASDDQSTDQSAASLETRSSASDASSAAQTPRPTRVVFHSTPKNNSADRHCAGAARRKRSIDVINDDTKMKASKQRRLERCEVEHLQNNKTNTDRLHATWPQDCHNKENRPMPLHPAHSEATLRPSEDDDRMWRPW